MIQVRAVGGQICAATVFLSRPGDTMPGSEDGSSRALRPESPLDSGLRKQVWWALILGLGMLVLGSGGIFFALRHFEPNALWLTARNSDKDPITFDFRLTGIAILCGLSILGCFVCAFRFFERIPILQDRETRWNALLSYQELGSSLPVDEVIRLIEEGPSREIKQGSPRPPVQLHLVWPFRSKQDEVKQGKGG
jgi:hypothetical protein